MRQTFRTRARPRSGRRWGRRRSRSLGRDFGAAPREHLLSRRAASWLGRVRATLRLWQDRVSGRQQLLRLDEHVLRDIGITRLQAEAEANKPFWRA